MMLALYNHLQYPPPSPVSRFTPLNTPNPHKKKEEKEEKEEKRKKRKLTPNSY